MFRGSDGPTTLGAFLFHRLQRDSTKPDSTDPWRRLPRCRVCCRIEPSREKHSYFLPGQSAKPPGKVAKTFLKVRFRRPAEPLTPLRSTGECRQPGVKRSGAFEANPHFPPLHSRLSTFLFLLGVVKAQASLRTDSTRERRKPTGSARPALTNGSESRLDSRYSCDNRVRWVLQNPNRNLRVRRYLAANSGRAYDSRNPHAEQRKIPTGTHLSCGTFLTCRNSLPTFSGAPSTQVLTTRLGPSLPQVKPCTISPLHLGHRFVPALEVKSPASPVRIVENPCTDASTEKF